MKQKDWICWLPSALALMAATLFAPNGAADWLVTHDGAAIETQGPWQEKGRLIVFTASDGTLSSIRASEIDLEASRLRTEQPDGEPVAEAPAEPPAKKAAVLVLTDDDVGHLDPLAPAEESAAGEEEASGKNRSLEVVNWRQADLPDGGVRIHGTLRNNGDKLAVGISVDVNVLDVQGEIMDTKPAILTARGLRPSEMANFQVDFPEVILFDTASFKVSQVDADVSTAGEAQAPQETEPPLGESPSAGES